MKSSPADFFATTLIIFVVMLLSSFGAYAKECYDPLGLGDGRIKDTDITATSVKDNNTNLYGPGNARLKRYGGYRAEPTSSNTRALEVHFHQDMIITGIATQGYFGGRVQEWTKKYLLGYKVGASSFFFKKAGNAEILLGNQDSSSIVFHNVSQPALVNSVLVFPSEWQNNFAIRLELYGCIADGNECLSSPCQNNGSCWDKIRGYECNCTAGFNGSNCEINIDDCASSPCHHGGNCTDLVTDFSCVCMPGYTGKSCDGEIDECNSSPCRHNGTCVDLFNDYHCNCTAGYNGTNCELDIDECSSSPCLNNATCLDRVNGYNCTCAAGFTGKQCKTDVDECLSNPCQHAGTCTDQVNGYMCSCPVGFGGLRCEKDTAFFLIAWFKLKNLTFTYSLLNESSALYQSTEKAVVNEVDAMLRLEDKHFFGSALSRFSPSGTDSVIAEVLLRTLQNSTDHIATVIKQKMKVHTGIFEAESNYKSYENRAFPGCKPPNITLPLLKNVLQATKMKKSEDFTFRISAQIHCPVWGQPGSVQALYTIALYSVNRTSGTVLKVTTSIGTLVDDIDWTIRAIHLSYGVYYFKLTTDIERQTGTTVSNFGYIEVTSTALVVGIMGKTEASRGLNQTLTLDASRSHDPDVGPGNYAGLTFTWLCKRKNEKFPDDITSLPVVTPHSGSSSLLIQGGCYGTGVGRLKSRPGLPFLVDLDVENMEGDQDYVVKLVLTKRGQSVSAVHSVRINDEIRLSIKCIQNCQPRVTLSTRLILETTCTGLMCKNIDSYVWSMEYRNKSEPTWHEITNLDDIVLTLANSPNFVTKEAKLFANASYIVTVNGTTSGGHSSIVSYTFVTNQPPMGGSCTVDKTEGKAWQTDFIFTCSGWHDEDLPLIYKFRYNSTDGIMMVFQTGPRSTAMGKLPVGNENHDYDLHVQVRVCDALESSADVWIIIKVTDPDVNTENLLEAVSDNGKMNEYLKNNDIELAAQRATAVLSVVNHAEAEEVKIADRIKIKDSIVDSWASVNISELEEVSQVSAVVASAANKRNELSIKSQEKAVGILDSMTIFMSSQVKNKTYYDNEELVEHVGTSLLNGMGNLLDITAHEAREQDDSEEDAPFIATKDRKEKSRSYSQKILNLVNQVGSNVEYTKELHEKPSVLRTQSISMLIDRQVPSRIGDKTLEDQGTKVTLPSVQELIGSGSENQESLSTQLVTFKTNPFTWDESARDIKSSVLEFELKDALGNPLNVSNLTQEVELFIPPLKTPEVIEPEKLFVKPSDNGTMRFHKIDIPGPEYAVSIRIVPIGGKNLSVFVRYAKRPTLEEYNFTAAVPDYSSCNFTEEYGYSNCSTDPFVVTISAAITGHTGLHYVAVMYKTPGGERKESNITEANTQARVRRDCSSHSGRQKRSCVGVKDPPTTPPPIRIINPSFNASTDVNYTMSVTIATCLYWKAIANKWTTEGCRVGSKSRPEALQCLCTHLSSFGGNFLVAPNPIDFDYVFTQFPNIFESGNVVVLATVLSIFGLYIIGLVIARRADRKDERKAVENLRLKVEGEHLYEVSVYTGMWKGCGTSANVAMVVYGEDSRSETLHLFDSYSDKRLFARASINNFLISLPDTLHSPVKIKLWHDNSGTNPSWYVNQVVVRDTEADGKWYFLCNRWLAVDKEDGEVEVNVPLASKKDLSSFKYQFYTRVTRNLGDGHIWLSVVTRPPHSPFTRAQRLSCCICVLLCAMLAGAMFYQFGKKQEDTVNFGPLRFSLRQLVIGVQSALVVVPLNLLIVTIFRNVKTPSNKRKSQKQDDEETGRGNGNVANLKPAKKAKTPGCLPHFFVYVGWVLCILASLAAGTFIVFYSVQWGKEVSNQWLTSALISFVQDIAVMQPIKVILIAVVLALILKKPPEEKTAQSVKDADLEVNKNVVVVAPKGDELVKARKHRESVVETISTLVEMVFFLLFVICLFIVVYGNRGYNRYRLTAILENVFQESFEEIDSSDAFWAWVEEEFVPGVYDTSWYNDQRFIGPEGYISTREAFLVGMPKFRQVRVKEEYPCEVATSYSPLKGMFKRCIPVYSPHVEDTTRYNLPGWIPVTNMSLYDSVYDLSRLCPKPWRYNTSGELDTLSSQGRHASYDGGGYVADLGYNSRTAMNVIRNLKHNNWIDEKTAVVFVEFTVFQPSSSLFSVGKFIYEVLPTGKPETRTRIDTLSIYPSPDPGLRSFFVACQIVLVLLIAYFLLVEAVRIYRQGCSYFRSFWNWMNLLQLLSAITTVAFFFFKEKYVSSYVKHVQANPFETASPDYVIFWSELELIVLSIIVFIVTVKFLRIIRFNRHICQMISSLKLASTAIASYSVLFFIDLVSFSLLGVLVFGNELEQYHSFLESLSSLFQKFLGGDLHFYELQAVNRVLGPLFVFAYMLSMGFILINMFVAILNDSYESVKELSGGKFADAELGVFIKEYYLARLQRLHDIVKRKLGNLGYRHKLYDRPRTESKVKRREDYLGSFLSLPSDYPPFVELRDRVDCSSQLNLLDNEETYGETETSSETNLGFVPVHEEAVELTLDKPDADSAPSVDCNSVSSSSNADILDLFGELPESMVDDDETIDNVRKDLAEVGAVLRLSKRSYRRFSSTGDKYVVQTAIQMGPSVAITFRPRRESDIPK